MLLEKGLVRLLELETRELVAALFEPSDDLSDKAVATTASKKGESTARVVIYSWRAVNSLAATHEFSAQFCAVQERNFLVEAFTARLLLGLVVVPPVGDNVKYGLRDEQRSERTQPTQRFMPPPRLQRCFLLSAGTWSD